MSKKDESPVIVVLEGELKGKHWALERDVTTIGRDDICDIVIPNRRISRQHIALKRVNSDQFMVEDLESKNGTWLNGNRLEGSRRIDDGDEIHLALSVRLQFIGRGITAPVTQDLPDVIPSSTFRGRLRIDIEARRVYINNVELDPPLSLPQYRLLELLYLNMNRVCTREEVIESVWPEAQGEGVSEQAIDALVRRLRDRLAETDPEWQYILTVRGHGFRLNNPTEGQ